jgi:hypothetical protein
VAEHKYTAMKTTLHKLLFSLFIVGGMISFQNVTAQVSYTQDFAITKHNWTTLDFNVTDAVPCNSPYALRALYKNFADTLIAVNTTTPSLGISNGEQIVLSYNYKVLLYNNVLPYQPATGNNWGSLAVEYGPTVNGPWTVIDIVTAKNHRATNDCTFRKVAFTPARDSKVYVRFSAGGGNDYANGYYVYISNFAAIQDNITNVPLADDDPLKVFPNPVQDYLTIQYKGTINNVLIFDNQGKPVSLENIDNNFSRYDFSGLDYGKYTLEITADDEVRTVNVEKKQGF